MKTNNLQEIDYEAFKEETLKAFPNLCFDEDDRSLISYAKENKVPIIKEEGLAFLLQIIRIHKPKEILEIGTAIGYSAIQMAKCSNACITTIEKDEVMYHEACKNIEYQKLNQRIRVFNQDALESLDDVSDRKYDLIFIDAAKGQYKKFFNLYEILLNTGGIIISDNLLFHNLLFEKIENRNLRQLITKIKDYNQFLLENKNYDTSIFQIGDGMSVSIKK